MKKISIALTLLTLFSGHVKAINTSAADMGSAGVSAVSALASGMIVISPIYLPIAASNNKITSNKENKAQEEQEKAQKIQQTIPKDAVAIDALDKNGQASTIYMPKEAAEKVNISKTDRIELIPENNGITMKKNGKTEYFFMLPEDAEKTFHQTRIQTH